MIVPFSFNIKGWREGDEDKVVANDIGNDFIKRWCVAHANVAGRVVVSVKVPPSLVEGGREWPCPSDWAPEVGFDNKGGNKTV